MFPSQARDAGALWRKMKIAVHPAATWAMVMVVATALVEVVVVSSVLTLQTRVDAHGRCFMRQRVATAPN